MSIKSLIVKCSVFVLAALIVSVAQAADSGGGGGGGNSAHPYINLSPSFVTNYDGGGRLRYLKVDVAVRVLRPTNTAVVNHMPYIRNALIELFSSQLEENLSSTQGVEILREKALAEVRRSIDYLEGGGGEDVTDLYFTSFVLQQ
ncbi:MAG: flagellar basal body-associated FliL family protein [Pseudohongiellaceae bacterium]|nr:flagellar basal body-associated FliL family protein [Pseudohongiellaceae bacterium]